MNTPAHLIFAAAAFARPATPASPYPILAILAGALLPDLSLYLMSFWHLVILGTPGNIVFGELYFSPFWQRIFAIDNSFFLWGGLLALGYFGNIRLLILFALAGLLHLALDFPLHHDDGRAHFWPLTMWIYESPLSYWDWRHHAGIIAPIELMLCILFAAILWRRFEGLRARLFLAIGLGLEAFTFYGWMQFIPSGSG